MKMKIYRIFFKNSFVQQVEALTLSDAIEQAKMEQTVCGATREISDILRLKGQGEWVAVKF